MTIKRNFKTNFKCLTLLIGPEVGDSGSVGHLISINTWEINIM